VHLTTKVLVSNNAKNKRKSIADTHIDTAYEKYRRYLHEYSKSITDTIGSDTSTVKLTTLPVKTKVRRNSRSRCSRCDYDMSRSGLHFVTQRTKIRLLQQQRIQNHVFWWDTVCSTTWNKLQCKQGLRSRCRRLGLETYQRLVSVSSREKLSTSRSQEADVSVSSQSQPFTSRAEDQFLA